MIHPLRLTPRSTPKPCAATSRKKSAIDTKKEKGRVCRGAAFYFQVPFFCRPLLLLWRLRLLLYRPRARYRGVSRLLLLHLQLPLLHLLQELLRRLYARLIGRCDGLFGFSRLLLLICIVIGALLRRLRVSVRHNFLIFLLPQFSRMTR